MEKKETIRRKLEKKLKDYMRGAPLDITSLRARYCTPDKWANASCQNHCEECYAMARRQEMVPAREVVT
jgi:hypothetical protein